MREEKITFCPHDVSEIRAPRFGSLKAPAPNRPMESLMPQRLNGIHFDGAARRDEAGKEHNAG